MFGIKNKKIYCYKKFIFLMLCCFASLNCNAWLGWGFVKEAIEEHSDAYKKFAPEREATDIKVDTVLKNLGTIVKVQFRYTPETPHLKAYMEALEKLQTRVMIRSIIMGFLAGLPVGLFNAYSLIKLTNNSFRKILAISLIGSLMTSIGTITTENRSSGKHPHFDAFLKKYDNYFSNSSADTVVRIFATYISFLMGGLAGMSAMLSIGEKL